MLNSSSSFEIPSTPTVSGSLSSHLYHSIQEDYPPIEPGPLELSQDRSELDLASFILHRTDSPISDLPIADDEEDIFGVGSPSEASSKPPSPIMDFDKAPECTGVLVHWTAGSIWDTYPYHQHGIRSLPWEPIGFDGNNKWLRLRSKNCTIILSSAEQNSLCCSKCAAIPTSAPFQKFNNRAVQAAEHTPYTYLTHKQLYAVLLRVSGKYRQLVLKVFFLSYFNGV